MRTGHLRIIRAEMSKTPRRTIDWEAVELAYRLGVKSLRAIAAEQGCTDTAIRQRAKEHGWPRDLAAKVKAKADELVRTAEVRTQVRTETPTEREQVEISAQIQTNVVLAHRRDIPAARKLAMSMLEELQLQTDGIELLRQLGELMAAPDEKGQDKRNELYLKVISLGGRASTLKSLADTLKTLVALERQAFGIEDKASAGAGDALTQLLHGIASGNTNAFKPVAQDPDHDELED